MPAHSLQLRYLGLQPYKNVYQAMQRFCAERGAATRDELWLLEHLPVFTQGLNGKPEHILQTTTIPIVATDRGGQITYHGPGQLIVYCLLDIRRAGLVIRQFISCLENAVIDLLAAYDINAYARCEAPGVYVAERKIASLGLRIKRGCSYHGLSLNVAMDLAPFQLINPCGYSDLVMTQLTDCQPKRSFDMAQVSADLLPILSHHLGYTISSTADGLPVFTESKTNHVATHYS